MQQTQQNQPLPWYQTIKLFLMSAVVALEFFFIHVIFYIFVSGIGMDNYFTKSILCSFVVTFLMYYQYSLTNERFSLNTYSKLMLKEVMHCKGKYIKCLFFIFVLFSIMIIGRIYLYNSNLDSTPMFQAVFDKNEEIDYFLILETVVTSVLTEEIALRRGMMNTIKKYLTNPGKYLYIITGLCFGLIHFVNIGTSMYQTEYVLFEMGYGIVVGMILGIFTERLGILPTILIHMMNNIFAILNPLELTPFVVISAVIIVVCLGFIALVLEKENETENKKENKNEEVNKNEIVDEKKEQ